MLYYQLSKKNACVNRKKGGIILIIMKKSRLRIIIILLIVEPIFLSCIHNNREGNCDYSFIITIPEEISIEKSEVDSAFRGLNQEESSESVAEIIIYSFSSGKEVFSYSKDGEDGVNRFTYKGSMEVLLKTREGGTIKEVYFLKSEGDNKAELIDSIVAKVKLILCK